MSRIDLGVFRLRISGYDLRFVIEGDRYFCEFPDGSDKQELTEEAFYFVLKELCSGDRHVA